MPTRRCFFVRETLRSINADSSITSVRYLRRHANAGERSLRRRDFRRANFLTCEIAGAIKAFPAQRFIAPTPLHFPRDFTHQEGKLVNKSELIDAIAKHADISKAAAGRALDATVDAIQSSLKKGSMVTLVGFGSFYVGKRNARAGRNPRTNEPIKIGAAKVAKFRAGKALKDALN